MLSNPRPSWLGKPVPSLAQGNPPSSKVTSDGATAAATVAQVATGCQPTSTPTIPLEQHIRQLELERIRLQEQLQQITQQTTELRQREALEQEQLILSLTRSLEATRMERAQQVVGQPEASHVSPRDTEETVTLMCTICFERRVNRRFEPCDHAVCCDLCAERVANCPNCRASIMEKKRIFL